MESTRRDWRHTVEEDPLAVDIENGMHIASQIDTHPADIETLDSYDERIGDYKARDFTYIPIPEGGKYYNTEEGWMRELDSNQLVDEDTHLLEVLRLLQEEPFLLVDYSSISAVLVYDTGEDIYLLHGEEDEEDEEIEYTHHDNVMPLSSLDDDETENTHFYSIGRAKNEYPELSDIIDRQAWAHIEYDEDRYGIITLADINRRGVKLMIYVVLSGLVSKLSHKIEHKYPDSESVFKYLRPDTIGRWYKNQMEGLEIHVAEQMNLIEIMQIIQASDQSFVEECGFSSKSDVDDLNSINEIRNSVMHANRSLIYDRRDIEDVLSAIDRAQNIVSDMS